MNYFIPTVKIPGLISTETIIYGFSQRFHETSEEEKTGLKLRVLNETKAGLEGKKFFLKSSNASDNAIYFLKQIHSDRIYVLNDPSMKTQEVCNIRADAIVTHLVNKPIGIFSADCIPVIVHDPLQNVIGAIHAGRRGTGSQILQKTVKLLKSLYKSESSDLRIGLGPGIGPCCYEVGEDCLGLFRKNYKKWEKFIRAGKSGKFFLDLFKANCEDALNSGLLDKNIFVSGHCTSCNTSRFHSYRKEGSRCGRNVSFVMLIDK